MEKESFEAFKNSFFYGERCDLSFKFLAHLSEKDAADCIQELLDSIGETFDDGDFSRILSVALSWQKKGYDSEKNKFEYEDTPFTPFKSRVKRSKLTLITSSGHFVEGDDPEPFGVKDMTQEEATKRIMEFIRVPPVLSEIPTGTPKNKLKVRHGGYDIRGVKRDPNVAFPVDILSDMEKDGEIGELTEAYSFVGACSQKKFLKETLPKWVRFFKDNETDVALLVPV